MILCQAWTTGLADLLYGRIAVQSRETRLTWLCTSQYLYL
jgi:hypothetical protein